MTCWFGGKIFASALFFGTSENNEVGIARTETQHQTGVLSPSQNGLRHVNNV